MQKMILLLVSVLLVFSLASCKSKMKEEETTANYTSAYTTSAGDVSATNKDDSLVGEVTSIIDDVTSVADDIIDDVLPDTTSTTVR